MVVSEGMTRTHIVNSVRTNTLSLRAGAHSLLALLREHSVPLSILSAGLSDVIEEFLVQVNHVLFQSPEILVVSHEHVDSCLRSAFPFI